MKAYKLVRKMKSGGIAPLFINKKMRIPKNEWLTSENHPTKGFAVRQGWHCTFTPVAPHLSEKGREWWEVEVEDFKKYDRPESQGGAWILANRIRFIKPVEQE